MNTLYYISEEISNVYMSLYEADPPVQQPQDPNAITQQDPNANSIAQQDPNSIAQQDPNANAIAQQDPNANANAIADPKLDPIKKYILLTRIVELKQYLELYSANTESSKDVIILIKFIGTVIDFYDIFDYPSLKNLSERIMHESSKIIKQRGTKK